EHYEPNIAIDMRYWDPDYFPTQQARKIYNNLVRYIGDSPSTFIFSDPIPIDIYNNTVLNYSQLFSYDYFHDEQVYANNIIQCDDWTASTINEDYHPLFISNCLPYPFAYPWDILDGGGNIAADPMFADVSNDDYTLAAGSPCIDAGMMRPDLPEFDLRYHRRVAAGADGEDGVVDMGAYEYNSVYIGGINGYAYDSESGLPVDCVKIEISNKLPEFSDSLGCFNYPCGAGTFTVKASRWDYEDLIIPNVLVTLGEDTMLNIPLVWTNVTIDDESLPPKPADFGLSNHPNPFNPSTRLSFIAPETGELKLDIYNIKGQKVRTLYHGFISEGYHQIVWDGRDEKGVGIGSGICFAKIEMNGRRQIHKMMLMK
ncbi:MAG: hypothetical protein GX294_08365, partial [Candidatus Cloacimonetes bacterium]|nr:hypothetical protein [Candidatus Cloacimonadota bacterium]